MRYLSLAMMIFILNVSFAIVHNSSPFQSVSPPNSPSAVLPSYVLPSPYIPQTYLPSSESLESSAFMTGDFIRSLWLFIKNFALAPVMLASYIEDLGFPVWLANLLRTIFIFVYVAAIIQILGNRMLKGAR